MRSSFSCFSGLSRECSFALLVLSLTQLNSHGGEGVMVFYAMAGEPAGSMLLECILLTCRY